MTYIIADEMNDMVGLLHYGILRRSGRYPWGTGDNADTAEQRSRGFLDWFKTVTAQGLSEQEAAAAVGMTTTQLRETKTLALAEKKAADAAFARRLADKHVSNIEIAKRLSVSEGTVRNLLKPGADDNALIIRTVSDALRDAVMEKNYIDVGKGVETIFQISKEKLTAVLAVLKDEGYTVHTLKQDVPGANRQITYKVLAPAGATQKEVWMHRDKIGGWGSADKYSDDGGRTAYGILPPKELDPARVKINYAELDKKGHPTLGGGSADGVLYLRPGVADISIGSNQYAQVRVKVGPDHYLKGMAIYKDDLPDGIDVVFNTNKTKADAPTKFDAMKRLSDDKDNPFGSVIKRQIIDEDHYRATGKERLSSTMNILAEEGDWDTWSRTLSSQFLSKQNIRLAKQQLDLYHLRKQNEFDEIASLTNPVIKRILLDKFADSADSASTHLKAAQMPGQSTHVILPIDPKKMKPTEVYAPNFDNGARVVLVRHPHGGVFEIPELIVNNKNPTAKKLLGSAKDAIGINAKVAEQLSGADFDGDTVLVIPNRNGAIKTAPPLRQLVGFDPKVTYKGFEGMKPMSPRGTQTHMGMISNLINDMTILGAKDYEIAAAVRHSMVVIDAEKHKLNYKQSAIDNNITSLKQKYQGKGNAGAATMISRARKGVSVPDYRLARKAEGGPIDPDTGEKLYVPTGKMKRGKLVTTNVANLSSVSSQLRGLSDDARREISDTGTSIEKLYANHSNRMKALANTARKEMLGVPNIPYNPSARKTYQSEVDSLTAKYTLAMKNKPLERQAVVVASAMYRAKVQENPGMTDDEKKKVNKQVLATARLRVGAERTIIDITPREWEAIQSGALTNNRLKNIVEMADYDRVKELAMPKVTRLMSGATLSRAKSMAASGYTHAEIAGALGVGLTTLKEGLSA